MFVVKNKTYSKP